ncbi:hypothetical protein Taro_049604 [Colocasia esculenta]|uniref:Uncharacterized protein n=1 Tax=Colocasia esculenta TaxID=4460 RepID=A0A843XBM9_COLES|nr:hypothetical protein [Colocasia esculenta]
MLCQNFSHLSPSLSLVWRARTAPSLSRPTPHPSPFPFPAFALNADLTLRRSPWRRRPHDADRTLRRSPWGRRPHDAARTTPTAPFADRLGDADRTMPPAPRRPSFFPVLRLPWTPKTLEAKVVAVSDLDLKILEDGDHHPALKVRRDVLRLAGKLGEIRASAFHACCLPFCLLRATKYQGSITTKFLHEKNGEHKYLKEHSLL